MNQRHFLLRGTFILTLTGLLTRAAGFFYKIFLSRTIGASEIGLFQLTLPVCAFCMALASGGIQTAVSRFTAESYAEKDSRAALRILLCALLLSGGLSVCCAMFLFFGAGQIAERFLLEPACGPLLKMTAVSLPFSVVHGCIAGFFIGRKNVSISAGAQFTEQLLRIVSVLFFYTVFQKNGRQMNASVMALGQIAGELSSALFCFCHLICGKNSPFREALSDPESHRKAGRILPGRADFSRTVSVSAPLALNRMLLCVLQGIEAALLPQMLRRTGLGSQDALAVYGTLTGMALPLILFPTAVTAALGTLLLPAVSEARALRQGKKITGTIDASFRGSLLLGFFFLGAFLLFGGGIGELLFHSASAGVYTRKLALICPFLYINTTLVSILHALEATTLVTVWNTASFGIRLAAVLLWVPDAGIDGYIAGTLLGQAFITACTLFTLRRRSGFRTDPADAVIRPALICIAAGAGPVIWKELSGASGVSWSFLAPGAVLYTLVFLALAFALLSRGETHRAAPAFHTRRSETA